MTTVVKVPRNVKFTMLPDELLTRTDLSAAAKIVYCRLQRYRYIPTTKAVSEAVGMTYSVTRKALAELADLGLVERTGHGRYRPAESEPSGAYDTSSGAYDTSSGAYATPTRETEIQKETTTDARRASEGQDMNLGSFGDAPVPDPAPDLPRPRKGRKRKPVSKWNGYDFALYFEDECLTRYFGKATVAKAATAGFIKSRLAQGIDPEAIKRAVDSFVSNPRWVAQSSDMSKLLMWNLDAEIAHVSQAVGYTASDYLDGLDT